MSGLDDLTRKLGFSSGSDLLNQIGDGFFGTNYQKDYSHASKLMRPNGLALAPKQKFLFHVYFNTSDPKNMIKSADTGLVGALVKSIQLPSFKLDTKEYIQYNRKRLVHNRISYEPVTMKLHDDGENHVLDLWSRYYDYHFADSTYNYSHGILTAPNTNGKVNYNERDLYSPTRENPRRGWGKTIDIPTNGVPGKPAFFKDIKIYGFNRGGYVLYTLINPVITSWTSDTYDYAQGDGVMEHTVTLQYEAVKYSDSSETDGLAQGFAEPSRYDTEGGALGAGSTKSLFGQGGLQDTFGAVAKDLSNGNITGAIQKVGASAKTFGDLETLKNVVEDDSIGAVSGGLLGAIGKAPARLLNFPTPGETNDGKSIQKAGPKKAE